MTRKKLIEVALPLETISDAAAAEKNIHTGFPSNLHTWWSRKPLSAARAVLFASLVDDPSTDISLSPEEVSAERQRLFGIMRQLVYPSSIGDSQALALARREILQSNGGTVPPLFDPFAGGGSIPLESLRLGLNAIAADLNPVAVLLNKVMIEIVPKYITKPPVNPRDSRGITPEVGWSDATGLASDVDYYSNWMKEEARERIGHLFPEGPQGEPVKAWVWTRTVKCSNPACGADIPLLKKWWVSKHKGNEAWIRPVIDKSSRTIDFEVSTESAEPPQGTITKSGAQCLVCGNAVPFSYIREQGRDGHITHRLLSIVIDTAGGRQYLPPLKEHVAIAESAKAGWAPTTRLPDKALGFRVQGYGITRHQELFTERQLQTLATFVQLLGEVRNRIIDDSAGDVDYADGLITFLALIVDRLAQTNNTLVRWLVRRSGTSKGTPAFDRQVVSMVWSFSEGNVFDTSVGSWSAATKNIMSAFNAFANLLRSGQAFQHDAAEVPQFLNEPPIVSTDPPYYDNIGYADLADFYYIWLRKSLRDVYPDLFRTLLTPKRTELIAAEHLFEGDQTAAERHFLQRIHAAFSQIRAVANREYPVTIFYAFKQTERFSLSALEESYASTGWETMLEALIKAGFLITGTWPLKTEQAQRLRAIGSNALASSVVFCCRPRPDDAPITGRRQFVAELRQALPSALREMQSGNIAPVDLAQASIGPGMAVYSKYARVLEPDGKPLTVRTALQLINQVLDEYLAETEGDVDPDTRFAVDWFKQFGFDQGPFGTADVLARAKNTSVDGLANAGVLKSGAGNVQLLTWDELDAGWDPTTDKRPTTWEATHHLIERLNVHGEEGAALLLAKMPPDLAAAARQLAYRLYSICERKSWAALARDYNALVVSWSASQEQAAKARLQPRQGRLLE